MLQFVFTNLLFLSIGVILYITVRSLPRLGEDSLPKRKNVIERLVASEIPHRLDAAFNNYAGKFLRKLKVWLLRIDNILTHNLKRLSHHRTLNDKKIDFGEITSEKNDDQPE